VRNPIIVALDVPSAERAVALAGEVAPFVGAFKVGKELFVSSGPDIVRRLRATGASVFLDLKFHDIPNTVAKAVAAATRLDVQMLTIHCSGGGEMMRAAEASAQETSAALGRPAPLVLGVTVLTSMDAATLAELGGETDVARQVERLATLAARSGLRGLVCSPLELAPLRRVLPPRPATGDPGHPHRRGKGGRSEAHSLAARGAGRGRKLAGDRPADLRRAGTGEGGGGDPEVAGLNQEPGSFQCSVFRSQTQVPDAANRPPHEAEC